MEELCWECDTPHPKDRPHRYRIPCPDGRLGCAVAHYSTKNPKTLQILSDKILERALIGFRSWEHSSACSSVHQDTCDCGLLEFVLAVDAFIEEKQKTMTTLHTPKEAAQDALNGAEQTYYCECATCTLGRALLKAQAERDEALQSLASYQAHADEAIQAVNELAQLHEDLPHALGQCECKYEWNLITAGKQWPLSHIVALSRLGVISDSQ